MPLLTRARVVVCVALLPALLGCPATPDGAEADPTRSGSGSESSSVAGSGSDPVAVAVAASASAPVRELAAAFTTETGIEVMITTSATGALYAQAMRGAPFDVFVAADTLRTAALVAAGRVAKTDRRRWGRGRLVLFVPAGIEPPTALEPAVGDVIRADSIGRLRAVLERIRTQGGLVARADVRTAPYGAAAKTTLDALGLAGWPGPIGESVGQTLQYVVSGAAEAGFVARAQVGERPRSQWLLVPEALHPPLQHDVVLLASAERSPAARRFFDRLTSDAAGPVWRRHGYEPAEPPAPNPTPIRGAIPRVPNAPEPAP